MKAEELRIGNFVMSYGTNGSPNDWVEITVTSDHISTCSIYPELFKPIQLTEEWLLKLGFVKKEYSFVKNGVWLNGYENKYYLSNSDDDVLSTNFLKYVHQLQNLYFALT